MLWWMLQTSVVAAALAVVVAIVCRLGRLRPAVQHALWLVVLLKLASPNVVAWPWSVGDLSERFQRVDASVVAGREERDLRTEIGLNTRLERQDGGRNSAVGSRELTAEEQQLVQSVLMPGAAVTVNGEAVANDGAEQHASDAYSAGLRPPLAVETDSARPHWGALMLGVWASGTAVFVLRQIVRIMRFRRGLRCTSSIPRWLQQSVEERSAELEIPPPPMLVARDIASPCIWCLGPPRLVWPERLADDRQPARWQGVIVHELAHLRRRDHWVAWLELVAGCVWWWNPLYWLVRRQVRSTADLACDAWAMWLLPDGQREYAESLLEVTQNMSRISTAAPVLGAAGSARRSYQRRIEMIMSPRVPCRVSKFGLLCAGLLATLSVPAWSLDDKAPPTADNSNYPFASSDISSDAALTPASSGAAATGTSGDPTTATAGAAVDSDPATGSGLQGGARIERLERRLEALLDELRALRVSGRAPPQAFTSDGKLMAAVIEDGDIAILEAGTGKLVRRIDLGAPVPAQTLTFDHTGSVLILGSADGTVVQYDVATGKTLSMFRRSLTGTSRNLVGGISSPLDTAPAVPGTPAAPSTSPFSAAHRADSTPMGPAAAAPSPFDYADPNASSPAGLAQSLAGAQIDLIRLSTEYVEAVGAKKLAERHLSRMQGLDKADAIPEVQVVTAEVNYETASNKVALLRAIAEAAAEATKGELEFAERMAEKGYASSASVAQLKAKLRIISLILDGGTGTSQ